MLRGCTRLEVGTVLAIRQSKAHRSVVADEEYEERKAEWHGVSMAVGLNPNRLPVPGNKQLGHLQRKCHSTPPSVRANQGVMDQESVNPSVLEGQSALEEHQ